MVEIAVKRPMRKRKRSGRKTFLRQKVCRFCADKEMAID